MRTMSFATVTTPPRRILVLSAATLLAAAIAVTAAPTAAHAQAGRRLCMYVNGERTEEQSTRYVVVDYKKDGKCPSIDPEKYPTLNSYVNPVPKATCEEISAEVEYESKYYGDLCNFLTNDIVYTLLKRDSQPFHVLEDLSNHGHVRNFR
jgi:hypothetical protein